MGDHLRKIKKGLRLKTIFIVMTFILSSTLFANEHVGEMVKHKISEGPRSLGIQTSYVSTFDAETFDYTPI